MSNIIVSFSGGRTSAYMLHALLLNHPEHSYHVVFANTGQERPETLEFVHQCTKAFGVPVTWVEALVNPTKGVATCYREVSYENAYRPEYCWNPSYGSEYGFANPFYQHRYAAMMASRPVEWGHPFEQMLAKYGISNSSFPHCSREMKTQPIGAWARVEFADGRPFDMALGIRADEDHRAGEWWYPLIEWGVTEPMVRDFWRSQPFDLQLESLEGNCDLCWKKGHNKNWTLLERHPVLGLWWQKMEGLYGHITPDEADRRITKAMRPLPLVDTLDVATNGLPPKKGGPFYFNHNAVSMPIMYEAVRRGRFRRIKDKEQVRACACGVEFENLKALLPTPLPSTREESQKGGVNG